MEIKIMTYAAIAYVKKNIHFVANHYKQNDQPEKWLREALGEAPFVSIDIAEIPDFDLELSQERSDTDVKNIKTLYENMITLNDSFASDERLWAGLAHAKFYSYTINRWKMQDAEGTKLESSILDHFFFNHGQQRSYMVNSLARLWWYGRKLYKADSNLLWEYLDYISTDINGVLFTLFGSNWANNATLVSSFFETIIDYEKRKGRRLTRKEINEGMRFMQLLGGTYSLDVVEKEFIDQQLQNYYMNY